MDEYYQNQARILADICDKRSLNTGGDFTAEIDANVAVLTRAETSLCFGTPQDVQNSLDEMKAI